MSSTDDLSQYITCEEASAMLPYKPSSCTVWRWCRRGIKARGGEVVRLRHIRMGGKMLTTKAWVDAFGAALAAADEKYYLGSNP